MAIVMISDVPWFPKLGYPKADFASYVLIESVAKMVRDRCLSPVFAENGSGANNVNPTGYDATGTYSLSNLCWQF